MDIDIGEMSEDISNRSEPLSLFFHCLHYISSHISHVESLIGFPQLIGLQLFDECIKNGQFVNVRYNSKAKTALKLFFDAYRNQGILESLDLKACHLFVNDTICECPWLLSSIRHLDLSSCKLGDDHELLALVINLARLATLSLRDNCLTDNAIWKATLPLKFQKATNSSLQHLDLSANKVTLKCLSHLAPLVNLSIVCMSQTAFKFKGSNLRSLGRFTSHLVCPCLEARFSIETSGWAAGVVDGWKCENNMDSTSHNDAAFATSSKPLSASVICHEVKSFYSKRSLMPQATKESWQDSPSTNVMLTTGLFHCEHVLLNGRHNVDLSKLPSKQVFTKNVHPEKLGTNGSLVVESWHRKSLKRSLCACENDTVWEKTKVTKNSPGSMVVDKELRQEGGLGENRLLELYSGEQNGGRGGGKLLDLYSGEENGGRDGGKLLELYSGGQNGGRGGDKLLGLYSGEQNGGQSGDKLLGLYSGEQNGGQSGDKLLELYSGEQTQIPGHSRGSLLKELHDWNQ